MDMMSTMMELDKLPDPFTHPFQDFTELHFSGDNPTTNHRAPPPPPPPPLQPIYPTTEPPQFPLISHDHYPRASWLHHKPDSVEAMREMIFRMAALQPVQIDPESVKPPKRRNVRISKDPQSVAARHRRERISERIRILQRLVPGGTKMDTASMLDEAVHYMKFLKKQVESLEQAAAAGGGGARAAAVSNNVGGLCPTAGGTMVNHHNYVFRACGESAGHMVGSMELLK